MEWRRNSVIPVSQLILNLFDVLSCFEPRCLTGIVVCTILQGAQWYLTSVAI